MAVEQDLEPFFRGDTWTNKLVITDSAGDPVDITGRTYWVTLKLNPEETDANADAQRSVVAQGAEASNGIVYVKLLPEDTVDLLPTTYNYDIQQVIDANTVLTLLYGKVRVIRDITRTTTV